MEKNRELQKRARPGKTAIKGTLTPNYGPNITPRHRDGSGHVVVVHLSCMTAHLGRPCPLDQP